MRRLMLVLSVIAVVAVLLVSAAPAAAQEQTEKAEVTLEDLPKAGGPPLSPSAVILPGMALLVGGGLLVYAVVRRR
jgi:hypothetical protein